MSSNDEEYGHDLHQGKKRRVQRACDVCRRRKSRCDGSQTPGDKCSICFDADLDCTYLVGATRRAPAKSYVESLETRLEHSEALVRQLRGELAKVHFNKSSASTKESISSGSLPDSTPGLEPMNPKGYNPFLYVLQTALRSLSAPAPPPHADDLVHVEIMRKVEQLSVGAPPERHFIGKSSGAVLLTTAIDLKADVRRVERRAGSENGLATPRAANMGTPGSTGSMSSGIPDAEASNDGEGDKEGSSRGLPWTSRRLHYWTLKPWEITAPQIHSYSFPSPDLAAHLIDLYFTRVNIYLPLLHRPTFERGVQTELHRRDDNFAAILLLVCAVGSRWSDDPRVVPPSGTEGVGAAKTGTGRLACGWGWFDQVPLVGKHIFGQATLYDLQYYCLAVLFLEGSSAPQACWTLIGVGLRLAQDVGAHRRDSGVEHPSVERELWKRAFWVLVYMDRTASAAMGRPCAIQYDDFDIDLPVECDDEYWEHPTHPFQQPPGVPSRVAFFNVLLRLNHILSFSLKMLYSLSKVQVIFSIYDAWEEEAVVELDSALNSWRDGMPEHLRWDPTRADPVFFDQSVALHCAYCQLQILIHRPFIPMVRKSAPTALPSLAICTSAARACANMVDVQRRRKGNLPVVINLPAVFMSGIILLLNVWSGKRTGLVPDPSREIANVHKCMEVVRLCEDRWQHAGLFWDILAELASVGQLPLPNHAAAANTPTAPSLLRGQHYPYGHVEPIPPEAQAHILLGPRGLRQTFERPIHDAQFRAPYAPTPTSFAGGVGGGPGTFGPEPMAPSTFAPTPAPDTWFPPEDPFVGMNSHELDSMMRLIDSDTIAMWTNAPTGFEVDDWGTYFSNFSEIMQGKQQGMMMQGDMGMNGHAN
ncbi:fungal-specific transcription factor domain-containing protein [Mycena epipterygia]|nr:fungal-specific transcription factor domain-containing protein [Mycena epipterygia]